MSQASSPVPTSPADPAAGAAALDRARAKAYRRLLPLLFLCYVIAYVDRANVSVAKLTMVKDLKGFNNAVFGFGAGVFFIGYILLEIPGSILVERWSARKWISRIMISWGIVAALTATVKTPFQFYSVRFLLGLAEAGFFPGVIIYLTHWFSRRDRTRALSYFIVATPFAQIVSPKISNALLKIGTDEVINGVPVHHPEILGLEGWQWVYIVWGLPAVILGILVLFYLPDRPGHARWLNPAEREALDDEIKADRAKSAGIRRMGLLEALSHPTVLLLAVAYFCTVTGNYGIEFFLPTILEQWYKLKIDAITWLVILPPALALFGQLFVGWNSDRTGDRRWHAVIPIMLAIVMLALTPFTRGHLALTIACFMLVFTGIKSYQPAFWSLPSLFLTSTAAAGSVGLINSVGNLGGFVGPYILGFVQNRTGSFVGGLYFLCCSMAVSVTILLLLGLGRRDDGSQAPPSAFPVIVPQPSEDD
jgi:ACS family tartrate transporter-like MFS transporter